MKSIQKIKRVQLNADSKNDFSLLGIVSSEPDYKVSLTLNNVLGISLKNSTPVMSPYNTGPEITFSRFSDISASPNIYVCLIANKTENNLFLKNLKNIDFILIAQNLYNPNYFSELADKLREIDFITAVFNIDNNLLNDKNLDYLIQ